MNNQLFQGANAPLRQLPMNRNNMSFHQPSSTAATGSAQPAVPPSTPPLATMFIKNTNIRNGQVFHIEKPADISPLPHMTVKRPDFPEQRQVSLRMMKPCVLYVQFSCEQKCRNLGICIHYQFVLGCQKTPDGLRCDVCVRSGAEQAIQGCRKCPMHQDRRQANPIGSRPEDFLATHAQKHVAEEILKRSVAGYWDDLPSAPTDAAAAAAGVRQAGAGQPAGVATGTAGMSGYAPAAGSAFAVPNQSLGQAQGEDKGKGRDTGGMADDNMAWLNRHQL